MHNVYFADFIITPENKPKILEVHGPIGGGLRWFRQLYGTDQANERYFRGLSELANGKPIYILPVGDICRMEISGLESFIRDHNLVGPLEPQTEWIDDMNGHHGRKYSDDNINRGRIIDPLLRRLGIEFYYFDDVSGEGAGNVKLSNVRDRYVDKKKRLVKGKDLCLREDEIGLVLAQRHPHDFPDYLKTDREYPFQIVNPFWMAELLGNKAYFNSILLDSELREFVPDFGLYGMGMMDGRTRKLIESSLGQSNGNPMMVKKPTYLHLGRGIRYLYRNDVMELLDEYTGPLHSEDTVITLLTLLFRDIDLFTSLVSIVQEFVPSKIVLSQRTGEYHQGYVRGITFDGDWIGGFWILSNEPSDTQYPKFVDLRKHRTHFSPLSPDDEVIVRESMLTAMNGFENLIGTYDMNSVATFRDFRWLFWCERLKRTIDESDVFDSRIKPVDFLEMLERE